MGRFVWGKIKDVHRIGAHEIIEFHPYKLRHSSFTKETEAHVLFSVQTGPNHTKHYQSLDLALVGSLVAKYDGKDSQADRLIASMLSIPTESALTAPAQDVGKTT